MKPRIGSLVAIIVLIGAFVLLVKNYSTVSSRITKWLNENRDERRQYARLQLLKGEMDLAVTGDPKGQFNVGSLFYNGISVERDVGVAFTWWHKSALQGYAPAQSKLGECYSDGVGVAADKVEALKWHRLAAFNGDSTSMVWICNQHLEGGILSTDKVEAIAYLTLAKRYAEANSDHQAIQNASQVSLLLAIDPTITEETRIRGLKRADALQKEIADNLATKKSGK
jgi:TPR repeat protein